MSKTTVYNVPTPSPNTDPYTGPGGPAPNSQFVTSGPAGTTSTPSLPAATPSTTTPSGTTISPAATPVLPPATGTTTPATIPAPPSLITPGSPGNNPSMPTPGQVQNATNEEGQNQNDLQNEELSAEDYAVQRSSDLIADVSSVYSDELAQTEQNVEGEEAASGQGGGPVGASAEYTAMQPILNQQASAVASEIQNIQQNAASIFENTESEAQTNAADTLTNYQTAKTSLLSSVSNMAAVGYTPSQLQEQNPDEYDYLLNYAFNGDTNAMNTAFLFGTKSTLLNNGQPVYTNGTTQVYGQMTMNPDGTPSIKYTSIQLPYQAPVGWVQNKISTTTMMMQDPNNPANTVIYTTDPLTGGVNVTGTGTGATLAAQYNAAAAGSSDTSPMATPTSQGATTASTTVASVLGVDQTQPLADIVNGTETTPGVGIGAIVAALPVEEGGSPSGVLNNGGNIKVPAGVTVATGAPVPGVPGATNSGVQATDGGYFMSFDNASDYENYAASIVQNALSGTDPNYGPNPTLQSFVNTWTGGTSPVTTDVSDQTTGSNGLSTAQYGLLSNVQGFDPGPTTGTKTDAQAMDSAAFNYLQTYLKTGTVPTSTNVLGMRSGTSAMLPSIAQRAEQLYTDATGQPLPDQDILNANKGFISGNNSLLNSLAVQEKTIQANSDLMQGNINAENINQNAPVINGVLDSISNALGDPNVASYLAQNSTLSNELGSLLALKNASGTTVHDKLISADLISPDASAKQEAEVVNTLMKEAVNAHGAISIANAQLYLQNDPLGLDPQNPLSDPTQFASSVGLNLPAIQKDYPDMTSQEIITQYINSQ